MKFLSLINFVKREELTVRLLSSCRIRHRITSNTSHISYKIYIISKITFIIYFLIVVLIFILLAVLILLQYINKIIINIL